MKLHILALTVILFAQYSLQASDGTNLKWTQSCNQVHFTNYGPGAIQFVSPMPPFITRTGEFDFLISPNPDGTRGQTWKFTLRTTRMGSRVEQNEFVLELVLGKIVCGKGDPVTPTTITKVNIGGNQRIFSGTFDPVAKILTTTVALQAPVLNLKQVASSPFGV